ncbi:MAG: hypothetical protein WCE68_16930 [Anaerolineales bacterium]
MKKTLSVMFVLVLLFSLGSLDVRAQSAPTAIAYLPLLPAAGQNTGAGAAFQARQAYESLLPQLMQAQKAGQIVRFRPEFGDGMVLVEYPLGTDLASLLGTGQPVFATAQAALAFTQVGFTQVGQTIPLPGTMSKPDAFQNVRPASGPANPDFFLQLNDTCFDGGSIPAGDTYTARLEDTNQNPVAGANGSIAGDGTFSACFNGLWSGMAEGFTFIFKLYDSSGTNLLNTYSTTIPHLEITSFNPATKTVKGVAPAQSQLNLHLIHELLDSTEGDTKQTNISATTSSAGTWQASFSTVAMRGGDDLDVYYSDDEPSVDFEFWNAVFAPYLECTLGNNWCYDYGIPAAPASISIKHANKTYTNKGTFDEYLGYFYAAFYNPFHEPVILAAGDQAGGTGVKTMRMPKITAKPDIGSDSITGSAPKNTWFRVMVLVDQGGVLHRAVDWVEATGSGSYQASFSGKVTLAASDPVIVNIYDTDPVTGNETLYYGFITP